jgi:hypothetical protein
LLSPIRTQEKTSSPKNPILFARNPEGQSRLASGDRRLFDSAPGRCGGSIAWDILGEFIFPETKRNHEPLLAGDKRVDSGADRGGGEFSCENAVEEDRKSVV